jgi:hypothetical protein
MVDWRPRCSKRSNISGSYLAISESVAHKRQILTYNATTVIATTARCNSQLRPIRQKFCIARPGIHLGCLAATIRPAAAAAIQSIIKLRGKNLQMEFNRLRGRLGTRACL